ncbi:GNAT family protein [Luteococcus sanguinis]|uniref:GNAT family protein n=1 Tax=Luteococcus sanguinis TaxID=174038 RepID=A0ABW1X375_9ACTN
MLPQTIPTLEGRRVTLRPFRESDAPLVQSVAGDPLIPLITTVPTSGSLEDALAYIDRQHERLVSGAGYSFAIANAETDEMVGQIGLWLAAIKHGRASTGYWVAPQHRRRGYVSDALRTLSDWAIDHDQVQRLELYVEPWNEGSWRAAERCGFQREGLLRSWQPVCEERKDMYMYSRLRKH